MHAELNERPLKRRRNASRPSNKKLCTSEIRSQVVGPTMNILFKFYSCNCPTWFPLSLETMEENHANLNENNCDYGRHWRNRSKQRGSSSCGLVLRSPPSRLLQLLWRWRRERLPTGLDGAGRYL